MMTVATAGAASIYLGGKLAPGKEAWKSEGRPLVELGAVLYATCLRLSDSPIPENVALVAFRGLEHVHVYKREIGLNVPGFAQAVKKSVERPDEAFVEALKSMSQTLRYRVDSLLNHDQKLVERFSKDILRTMEGSLGSSPTIAEILDVIDEHVEENEGWITWDPVRALLEILGWR
ncbi:hypothetical protein [Methanopyrus sp. KOL6]|uniref:hypothetical protein n=1 Tax=Methanopyrus sp. KOL6 TaxID=1937004 RepID=UPI000B4B6762|nr:hypothetical protein [Methanopyrus sp. KOL6]